MRSWARKVQVITIAMATVVAILPGLEAHHYENLEIQPGAQIGTQGSNPSCTMNLIFSDDSGRLYAGTAGHCARVGDRMALPGNREFGTVVYREFNFNSGIPPDNDGAGPFRDFALIEIDEDKYANVNPAVRGFHGPVGLATDADPGTPIVHYGHGAGLSMSEPTRQRIGVLMKTCDGGCFNPGTDPWFDGWFLANTAVFGGDSGSPVLTMDGRALGVVSLIAAGFGEPGTLAGPTFERILQDLEEAGFKLTIVESPFGFGDIEGQLSTLHTTLEHCVDDPNMGGPWSDACARNPMPFPWSVHAHAAAEQGSYPAPVENGTVFRSYYETAWGLGAHTPLGSTGATGSVASSVPVYLPMDVSAITVRAEDILHDDVYFTVCTTQAENPFQCGMEDGNLRAGGMNMVTIRENVPAGTWVSVYMYALYITEDAEIGMASRGDLSVTVEEAE